MICNKNKYNRHPKKIPIGKIPLATEEGRHLHMDILYAQKLKFITAIDHPYSKFCTIKLIEDRSNLEDKVLEIIQNYPEVEKIIMDNEPGATTLQFKSLMDRLKIEVYNIEISRCIKEQYELISDLEAIYRAVQQYNKTIHSITKEKPYKILFNKVKHENIYDRLEEAQDKMLNYHNKDKKMIRYKKGDIIYEKKIGERNKLKPRYSKQKVKEIKLEYIKGIA